MNVTCGLTWIAAVAVLVSCGMLGGEARGDVLEFEVRSRVETQPGNGVWVPKLETVNWEPGKTAAVVCDMWDRHWCAGATGRVGEMAPRMNDVLNALRERGVLIIHCPSDTLEFYEGTPQRELAKNAPVVETDVPLLSWCELDEGRESGLPIDDSDGGCDCEDCEEHRAWSRQHPAIEIKEGDAITDSAEAYYLMRQRGITNVIVMGVHTNMCVLGRPFSVRQMVNQGQNVLLMRDMTDTMYNPAMRPWVSHFTGTDYVVEHIERHWCGSVTSDQVLGGEPFRFEEDGRTRLVMLIAEQEYETERTLQAFGRKYLGNDFAVEVVYAEPEKGRDDLRGLEAVRRADVVLVSARRRAPGVEQMAALREYVEAGKPIVGIRTASHAFSLHGDAPPSGHATWEEWDAEVIGGSYTNHWGEGDATTVVGAGAGDHAILRGVALPFMTAGSLYRSAPLGEGAVALLMGRFADKPLEPIAWTNRDEWGGRVFYTSLGHPDDFSDASFERLLLNGIYWAAGLE